MYAESFPSKLKAARDKTGLSQRDVAKELNISQPTITNYVLLSLAFIDLFTPQYSFHFYPL